MRSLLFKRRLGPLFLVQFFTAFNDNLLKNALVFLILFHMADTSGQVLVTAAGAVFMLPFFLLSGLGGQLADGHDKAMVAQRLKLVEIAVAALAVLGFWTQSITAMMAALFSFGVISALFGPIKYGILPDHLADDELPRGNALVESGTFLAVLIGTFAGGHAMRGGGDPVFFGVLMMVLAVGSWAASLFVPPTGVKATDVKVDANVFRSTGQLLGELWADAKLWRTGVMVSLFWMVGAVLLGLLPPLVKSFMGGNELAVSVYLAVFAISIAIGSGIGSFLSAGRIVLLPVPLALVVIGLAGLDLAWTLSGMQPGHGLETVSAFLARPGAVHVGFDLGVMAIAGGILIVPAFAAAQHWAPEERRARIVGAINALSAAFIVAGAAATGIAQELGLSLPVIFLGLALTSFAFAVWTYRVLPTNPLRDLISIILRAFYRLEVTGKENIAKAGPNAVIALNHVSFLDAAVAIALLDKDPVFAIDSGIAQRWWVKPFLKLTRAMPLDPTKPLATRTLINAVRGGDSLVIFPEGRLTVTGSLMKVYDGAGLIAEKTGVKVVPVRIEGLESTLFSYLNGLQVRRRWFPKVKVSVIEPCELTVDPALRGKARRMAAGAALYQIMSDLIFRTTDTNRTVFRAVIDAANEHGAGRLAVEDPVTGGLSYRKLLIGARVIGAKLAERTEVGEAVAVLLPNANAAVVSIVGLMSAGRVPAMINFTAGPANILSACRTAEVKTFVTSRTFIEKGRLEHIIEAVSPVVDVVYLEDLRKTVTRMDKIRGLLGWAKPLVPSNPDDRAAVLFTSGSEGTPKGVVLSHRNMLSNVAQASARIDFGRQDKVFNVLPVFHSFGLTAGVVLPLISGVPIYLYPSPLHYRIVPELVYQTNATVLFGTDTFLNGYARSAHAYDFRSLRYVVAGAEPVKDASRRVYMDKFGLRILEGYGVTETAPVLALNTPMFNRSGTVGRLLPGIEPRLEPVPGIAEGGRLHVRGPNVMMGYLMADKPGVLQPPAEGWHDTGDIVVIDRDGFVAIKGRAKRFAKIGGEMVSLAAIEALASECWPDAPSAAATVPDEKKGERIIMVTEQADATRLSFQLFAKAKGATELMIPAEVVVVETVPVLGTGKLDFPAVTQLVRSRFARPAPAPETSAG
jgi:acyl-[acyl-carrier-protein]-phospholipid O-acyltransferase/long-chain-fatty-acid--[acyl-carrier-protein] ligase